MKISDSPQDIHVVVQTPNAVLLDTFACELELEDQLGRFTLRVGDAALAALVPAEIVLKRQDGSEARIEVTWGSLTAVGTQARIVVKSGKVREVAPLPIAV